MEEEGSYDAVGFLLTHTDDEGKECVLFFHNFMGSIDCPGSGLIRKRDHGDPHAAAQANLIEHLGGVDILGEKWRERARRIRVHLSMHNQWLLMFHLHLNKKEQKRLRRNTALLDWTEQKEARDFSALTGRTAAVYPTVARVLSVPKEILQQQRDKVNQTVTYPALDYLTRERVCIGATVLVAFSLLFDGEK